MLTFCLAAALSLGTLAAPAPVPPPVTLDDGFETPSDTNLTWPEGWRRAGNVPSGIVRLDDPGHSGARCVRLAMPGPAGLLGIMRILPDSLRTGVVAVRLSGWLRAERAGAAGLWVHASGPTGAVTSPDSAGTPVRGTAGWARHELVLPVPQEFDRIEYGVRVTGGGTAWVDDVRAELLHEGQVPRSSPAALAFFEAAIDSVCRRTVVTSELQWGQLKTAARDQLVGARTPAETYPALLYGIRRLDRSGEVRSAAEAAKARAAAPAPLAIPFERPDDVFGSIKVPACPRDSEKGLALYRAALLATIRNAIASGVRGWIVDLRQTGQGALEPMLEGLAPLLGEGVVGGTLRPDGTRSWWLADHGKLEVLRNGGLRAVRGRPAHADSLPVAVLTSGRTGWEGEAALLALRARANVRVFGRPTQGTPVEREIVRLRDGSEMRFATARYVGPDGRLTEGRLRPDVEMTASDTLVRIVEHDSVTVAALGWLHARLDSARAAVPGR